MKAIGYAVNYFPSIQQDLIELFEKLSIPWYRIPSNLFSQRRDEAVKDTRKVYDSKFT
jgi:hypothetical protein